MKLYNFIVIMSSGYVHQVRLEGKDWDAIKDKEMTIIRAMMEIDFWRQINHTMLLEIARDSIEPKFSIKYEKFLAEIFKMRGRTK